MLNPYFNVRGNRPEKKLLDSLIIENIKVCGMMVYYIPRVLTNEDPILGEDPLSKFTDVFPIEMYFDNPVGWEGAGNLLSKFGMEFQKAAHFIVSRRRFNQTIKYEGSHCFPTETPSVKEVRPMEGDLVYLPLTNALFEVLYADHESFFYQWGGEYIWRIGVEKFRYSSERINTGVPEIDAVGTQHQNNDSTVNDPIADNLNIDSQKINLLDTSEDNPFGIP